MPAGAGRPRAGPKRSAAEKRAGARPGSPARHRARTRPRAPRIPPPAPSGGRRRRGESRRRFRSAPRRSRRATPPPIASSDRPPRQSHYAPSTGADAIDWKTGALLGGFVLPLALLGRRGRGVGLDHRVDDEVGLHEALAPLGVEVGEGLGGLDLVGALLAGDQLP